MHAIEHCRFAAQEIRGVIEPYFGATECAELLAIAGIIERRDIAARIERLGEDRAIEVLVDFVCSVEALYARSRETVASQEGRVVDIATARFRRTERAHAARLTEVLLAAAMAEAEDEAERVHLAVTTEPDMTEQFVETAYISGLQRIVVSMDNSFRRAGYTDEKICRIGPQLAERFQGRLDELMASMAARVEAQPSPF